jgi:membrane protein DedA with SNARE-associated domain
LGPLTSLEGAIRTLIDQHEWLALTVLFLSSIIEYVFPPFPGDTITLAGAVLVTGFGWSFLPVFAAVTAGSVVGSGLAVLAGQWLFRKGFLSPSTGVRGNEARRQIARLVGRFERHGEAYLVINRFLPGIRTFFFVAAGLANMRPMFVLAWSTVSATLWNLGIMGIGLLIGDNLGQLEAVVLGYSRTATIVITVVVLGFVTRWVWRRRRARRR